MSASLFRLPHSIITGSWSVEENVGERRRTDLKRTTFAKRVGLKDLQALLSLSVKRIVGVPLMHEALGRFRI